MWNELNEDEESHPARIVALQRFIAEIHGCPSEYVETVHVDETFDRKSLWQGDVEAFVLIGHPRAHKCYAWVKSIGRRKRVRFFVVFENTIVRTALDAVKFVHVASSAPLISECSKLGTPHE